ncbi:MAG: hypothetical protein MRY49_00350, partial [Candidatus Pacebacteria bacterium]|nr:hypothetical protein [Candidatus Paceibacterota bacterium]
SSIVVGTLLILFIAKHAGEYIWLITGIAAGNLLFIAASDLLPRIHGNTRDHESIWKSAISIIIAFSIMTSVLTWTHENFGHGHEEHEHAEKIHSDEHHE